LYYYANGEFKKEERKDTILTIDTRFVYSFANQCPDVVV
jgi:hypothetical protein